MRIIYLADIRFPLERANGIQTMATCHALAERGHVVHLVVRPDTHRPARDPFEYYGLPRTDRLVLERAVVSGPNLARRVGYLAFALGRTFGRRRADAIVTRDLGVASILLEAPRAVRPPLVYESHGFSPEVAAALPDLVSTAQPPSAAKLRRLERREARVWRQAEGYVTITQGLMDEMIRRFGERASAAVVPDGVRHPASTRTSAGDAAAVDDASSANRRPVVAYAGHLYAWKGVDVLVEALASVPEVDGMIVGGHEREADLARLTDLAVRVGLGSRIRFTGLVPPAAVADLLKRATVLALPNPASAISTRFTSPLKLFEYMAAHRPIVASDLPAIREVLEHEQTALLVPPGDPHALAGAIRRLIADPALAGRLAAAAAAKAEHYSWDRRAGRLEALLQQVTASD